MSNIKSDETLLLNASVQSVHAHEEEQTFMILLKGREAKALHMKAFWDTVSIEEGLDRTDGLNLRNLFKDMSHVFFYLDLLNCVDIKH